jgi:DNA-binding SARP family transcriptional activator
MPLRLSYLEFVLNHLAFSFLGTFQAWLGDAPLTSFRSAKAQGLLIYLALTMPYAHGRDLLSALFWPDEPEQVAKQNLRQALYLLRKVLGDDQAGGQPFLRITRTAIQFNPASDYRLDVADFLAALAQGELETAVALYHGDLLPGFSCDSLPVDEWVRQERERLHQQAIEALAKLTNDRLTDTAGRVGVG